MSYLYRVESTLCELVAKSRNYVKLVVMTRGYAHELAVLQPKSLQDVHCILSLCQEDLAGFSKPLSQGNNASTQDPSSRIQR